MLVDAELDVEVVNVLSSYNQLVVERRALKLEQTQRNVHRKQHYLEFQLVSLLNSLHFHAANQAAHTSERISEQTQIQGGPKPVDLYTESIYSIKTCQHNYRLMQKKLIMKEEQEYCMLVLNIHCRSQWSSGSTLACGMSGRQFCIFHENHCDTQFWARTAHLLQGLGRLSLPPSEGQ